MAAEKVRVRYAPSPTGEPHIGNIRTALFNWLFARHVGGDFIVRIEDTDQERLVPGAVDSILDGLEWLGIDWDEGPRIGGPYGSYFQSERLPGYDQAAEYLISEGAAYRCYCSRERLDQVRKERQQQKLDTAYDRHCRDLTPEQRQDMEAEGGPSVVRFAMPTAGTTSVQDLIRGEVEWQNRLLDDFIILKSDGFPTYHLAVVVDDHLMEVSHVLRAEEWLPSTPRHINLYRSLGYDLPQFGHLPMILGPDRSKLSKRHGATSILEYRDDGFLPEALKNFMLLLGWSLDDHTEVMADDFIVENFALERVGKPAAIFDVEKLQWMNGLYIRELSSEDLADRMLPFLERDLAGELLPVDRCYLLQIVPLIQERLKLLTDAAGMTSYFFEAFPEYDPPLLVQRGSDQQAALAGLKVCLADLEKSASFDHSILESLLRERAEGLGLSLRQFFGSLRVAVTGRTATPPLFETMEVLGRERVLSRLQAAVERLSPA